MDKKKIIKTSPTGNRTCLVRFAVQRSTTKPQRVFEMSANNVFINKNKGKLKS